MLGIAHTLISEGLHNAAYLERYCVGFEKFKSYVLGQADGEPKTAAWAGTICSVDAHVIRSLARRMAKGRTMIGVAYSLQRAEHGEQTYWGANNAGGLAWADRFAGWRVRLRLWQHARLRQSS